MREALERLDERERELLEWYLGQGLSERAIGARLGCSHVVVHRRLHRAWGRLCAVLGWRCRFQGLVVEGEGGNEGKRAEKWVGGC